MDTSRRLKAWQHCRALAGEVYRVTAAFPAEERFGMSQQLRRAAVSALANIAEGQARFGAAEFAHALSVALGSLAEVSALMDLATDLGYVGEAEAQRLEVVRAEASRTTFGLQRKLRR
jgi:four helix bundle protein